MSVTFNPSVRSWTRVQLPLQGSLNNPSVCSWTRVQLLTGARPLCRSATFPHTVGNHPFQGSLNNPSVCSRCSQPAPDGRESPLSLRDISPHRGESPFTREPNLIPQSTHFVRSQLLTGESPLCRSATFPHTVGNHPI